MSHSSRSSSLSRRQTTSSPVRGSVRFFDKSAAGNAARAAYLKVFVGGTFMVILMVFMILPIYWGALWKIPARNLNGWVVDFDGGLIGQRVSEALLSSEIASRSRVTWHVQPADRFAGSAEELSAAVREEKTWVAIAIMPGATERLTSALVSPNATYDSSRSIIVYGVEARNENAFRSIIRTSADASLSAITRQLSIQIASTQLASADQSAVQRLLQTSPQTIVSPVGYTINNLVPFDQPVATAATFVGMLYQLIMSFFIVMIGTAARELSGYVNSLSTTRLSILRLASSTIAYFFISLFYCLLNLAFHLDVSRKFGHSGFLVFWMANFVGMLAVGFALESAITILTVRGIPFFMLLWIIANLSVCIFPIDVLPVVFRYGYATPFYNLGRALRTIVFGTKNTVGESIGILLVWTAISCITLPFFQWLVRRAPKSPEQQPKTESALASTASSRGGAREREHDVEGTANGNGFTEEKA